MTCNASSGVPPLVRAEGHAELVGDVLITCTGGDPSAPFMADFEIRLNTNITSRLVVAQPTALSETVLLIDEPGLPRLNQQGSAGTPTPFCVSGGTATVASCNPAKAGETYQQNTYTVFRGARPSDPSEQKTLVWTGIPVIPPGANQIRTFRIGNLRANAAAPGASQTLIPTNILAYVSVSPQGSMILDNSQQTVGFVQNGMLFDVRACNGEAPVPANQVFTQCSPTDAQRQFFDNPTGAGTLPATGSLRFREGFRNAFKRQIVAGQSESQVGSVYDAESGFVRPQTGAGGVADAGTRLAARFTNVPAGVRVFVSTTHAAGTSSWTKAVLVATDSNGASALGSPTASRPAPTPPSTLANLSCGASSVGAIEVLIVNGSGLAVWEVTESSPVNTDTLLFTYGIAYRQNTELGMPALGAGFVSELLAPFYPLSEATQRMQGFEFAIPRFVQSGSPIDFMFMTDCTGTSVIVTIASNVREAVVLVDDKPYTTPKGFAWKPGENHVLDIVSPQAVASGIRRRFVSWSDGGSVRKTITVPAQPVTITAKFVLQYSVSATAGSGGTVSVSPASPDGFYDAGATVQISATPLQGYTFISWTGILSSDQTISATLAQPVTATAHFRAIASRFVPVTPCRVADTRNPVGPLGGPAIAGGTSRSFAFPGGGCGIPSTALAYSINVTVVPHGFLGFLTVWPTGHPQPVASILNSYDGRVKANAAIVPAGTGGAISVLAMHTTDVILDINGYFVPDTTPSALAFYPLTPCRVADTRFGTGPLNGPALSGGKNRNFPVRSSLCGVPATAQAYSLNYTAVPRGALGHVTTWPTGGAAPVVSTLNATTGQVTANAAIVPAGTNGDISVYSTDDADLVIDINGYFAPPGPDGLSFRHVSPCRVVDTREPAGVPPFSGVRGIGIEGHCGIAYGARAYVVNATVVPPGLMGFLTLWPFTDPQPTASTLNAMDGTITSNMAIVPGRYGSISSFAAHPTHLLVDVSGYFAPQ